MRALIWIIILVLVIWGIWYWVHRTPSAGTTNNPAAALQGLDQNGSMTASSTSSDTSTTSDMYQSKG